ncbi:4311_t:CDS:2, partial [Dentiscutata heterogama]
QLKSSDIATSGGNYERGHSGVVASSNTAISKYANYTNAKTVETLVAKQKEIVETLTTQQNKSIQKLNNDNAKLIKSISNNQKKTVVMSLSRNHANVVKTMNNNDVKKSKDTHDAYRKDDLIKMMITSNINVMSKLVDHVTSTSKAKNISRDNM